LSLAGINGDPPRFSSPGFPITEATTNFQAFLLFHSREAKKGGSVGEFSVPKIACIILVFCAASAIASSAQTLTTLANFDGANGSNPYSGSLIQGTNGNFYGTTAGGGANNDPVCASDDGLVGCGTVFEITPEGTLTTLYSFCAQKNCTDGDGPFAGLLQATNGNFYGTTVYGGANGSGTVFEITLGGKLTTLYSFCVQTSCADGSFPIAGLVQGTDGSFYGTTILGGASNVGTVFEITLGGALTTLHSFDVTDGGQPSGGLIQATDGNFYGTTGIGGNGDCTLGCGTVFEMVPSGALTTLHSFDGADGDIPLGPVQATDGSFYGTTSGGGVNANCTSLTGCGTIFSLSVALGPFVEALPASGNVGAPVTILGTNLTGATGVSFNGTAATFNVVSASEIMTTVPAGATTGTIQVTTPGGTLTSNANFLVIAPLQFIPATPCRVADTRNPSGPFGGPEPAAGATREFNIPQSACGIPTSAVAYSLNVTVVPNASLNYLTLWPSGQPQPFVSTLNSDGRVKANAAIVPAGVNGGVSVFVSDATQVILDIDGYFIPAGTANGLAFYPVTPCRVADTRNPAGPLGGPFIAAGGTRAFPVQSSSCNLPATAQAYSLNVTAVPHTTLNYLTIWPTGETQPNVSTLNSSTGAVTANAAIVPAGTSGDVSVFVYDDADVILDVNGYFAPVATGGLSLYTATPCRVIDTRPTAFTGTTVVSVQGSACAPSSTAEAYVLNATVVPDGALNYLTLWPDGVTQPYVSTLNADDGAITSNMAIVPTSNGAVDAYADGSTNLILDFSGYFAP
jgi:uncharacterized repeat protein (TIGR03803 family)